MIFIRVLAIIVFMAAGILALCVGFTVNPWFILAGVASLATSLMLHMGRLSRWF